MGIAIYIFTFIINLLLKIVFKLRLGLAVIYYLIMALVLDDWVAATKLNETIATIGFVLITVYCLANAGYGFYTSIKYGYDKGSQRM